MVGGKGTLIYLCIKVNKRKCEGWEKSWTGVVKSFGAILCAVPRIAGVCLKGLLQAKYLCLCGCLWRLHFGAGMGVVVSFRFRIIKTFENIFQIFVLFLHIVF